MYAFSSCFIIILDRNLECFLNINVASQFWKVQWAYVGRNSGINKIYVLSHSEPLVLFKGIQTPGIWLPECSGLNDEEETQIQQMDTHFLSETDGTAASTQGRQIQGR